MRKIIACSGIVSLLFLSSCVVLNEFPIEVFQPGKVGLRPEIKNITLVSRNLKYSSDTLQNYYLKDYRRIKDIRKINIDSLTVTACFDSLMLKMKTQKQFNKIAVLPFTALPVQHVFSIHPPSKNLIHKISSDRHADALILLDMYSSFYSVYPNPDNNNHSIAKVVTASIWTIYDSKSQMINHTSLVDTLYWDGLDENQTYSPKKIPNKKDALVIAAGLAGVNYSKNIVPNWIKVYRNTLSCNQIDFKKAANLAKLNKWEEAISLWGKYTNSTNKRLKMMALFNLAIASEMNGNIDEAIGMITKASEISSSPFYATENENIRKYSVVLAKRKIELNKIKSMNYDL